MGIYDFLDKSIVFENEPMSAHSSFRTGGPAGYLVTPENSDDVVAAIRFSRDASLPFFTMGYGTNLLISDKGFDGVIIKLCEKFSGCAVIEEDDEHIVIRAQAGCRLAKVASLAAKNSCTGMEALSGIPGSVGGAVLMNAGAYDGQVADVLVSSKYIDLDTLIVGEKDADAHDFKYRFSSYQCENKLILSADFSLRKIASQESIYEKMKELNKRRADKQPLEFPSAGSTFKRPEGYYAGALIEASGLKGYTIGGACVSEKHAGFVINKGGATSFDIYNLVQYIRKKVYEDSGVTLQTEIIFVGEF